MNILVALSSVPDTTSKINFTSDLKSLDKNGIQFVINPYDEFCLTKAVQLQENQGAKVTLVSVGDTNIEPVMRKALAIGANDAIRVNVEPIDSLNVAQEIAKIAKENTYDVLLFGKESIDYNGGIVPSLVASILEIPFVNAVIGLEINGNEAKITREIDGGKEVVSVDLPVILAGQKGIVEESELRIPNMRGIMQARTKQIQVVEPSFSQINVAVNSFEKPIPRSEVKLIDKDNLQELIRLLKEEAKVLN